MATAYKRDGNYLFIEIAETKYLVDTTIGYPRFFRELAGKALHAQDRANWKTARNNAALMQAFVEDVAALQKKWRATMS
ncbi:hypothetical protein KC726_03715 [Candidatus Woesebacteria bacterium]|nr:hypothetical protein [Candidatus Woesebacteria bacterium]